MSKFLALILIAFILPSAVLAQDQILEKINQKVTWRFEEDINKLSAIMEEVKRRKGLEGEKTLVAFGTPQNPIENADYWITFAHEALAFQRAQKYTSKSDVRYSLQTLAGKILRAKTEVGKALK